MAETNSKGPANPAGSAREDGALGFPVPKRDVLPVATSIVQAGSIGADALKAAEALKSEDEATGHATDSEPPAGRRKAAGA